MRTGIRVAPCLPQTYDPEEMELGAWQADFAEAVWAKKNRQEQAYRVENLSV